MQIRIIRSDADLTQALKEIDALWNAEPGTPEGDKLDVSSRSLRRMRTSITLSRPSILSIY